MSAIRPEVLRTFRRWREPIGALAFAGLGFWLALRGGPFYGTLGSLTVGIGLGLALSAWRRMRFSQTETLDPGVVRIDEGAIAYFGPDGGGVVALSELTLVEVGAWDDVSAWRLRQADGRLITVPMAALGAEALIDVFVALPGARMDAFVTARSQVHQGPPVTLWRRDGARRPRMLRGP